MSLKMMNSAPANLALRGHVFQGICLLFVQLFMLFNSVAAGAADHYRKYGTNSGKGARLSGKKFCKKVPRVIRPSLSIQGSDIP